MPESMTPGDVLRREAQRGGLLGAAKILEVLTASNPDLIAQAQREAASPFAQQLRHARHKEYVHAPVSLDHTPMVTSMQEYIRGIQAGDQRVVAAALRDVRTRVQDAEGQELIMQARVDALANADPNYQRRVNQLRDAEEALKNSSLTVDQRTALTLSVQGTKAELYSNSNAGRAQNILDEYRRTLAQLKEQVRALSDLLFMLKIQSMSAEKRSAQQVQSTPVAQIVDARGAPSLNHAEVNKVVFQQLEAAEARLSQLRQSIWNTELSPVAVNKGFYGHGEEPVLTQLDSLPTMKRAVAQYRQLGSWLVGVQSLRANPTLLNRPDWANFARNAIQYYGHS